VSGGIGQRFKPVANPLFLFPRSFNGENVLPSCAARTKVIMAPRYFHVTHVANLASIKRTGLVPRAAWSNQPRVWLTSKVDIGHTILAVARRHHWFLWDLTIIGVMPAEIVLRDGDRGSYVLHKVEPAALFLPVLSLLE